MKFFMFHAKHSISALEIYYVTHFTSHIFIV